MKNRKIRTCIKTTSLLLCILILAQCVMFSSCTVLPLNNNTANEGYTEVYYFFDTFVSITVYDEKDKEYLDDIEKLCYKYDNLLNRHRPGSDLDRINNAEGEAVIVDSETIFLIETALEFCKETDGAIDITVAPVLDLWDFTSGDENVMPPSDEAIKEALTSGFFEEIKEKYVEPELVPVEEQKEAETVEAGEAKPEDEAEPAFESEAEEAKPKTSSKGKGKK